MFEIDNHDGLLFYFLIAVCMFSVQKVDFFSLRDKKSVRN